ncbi:hypothetical protein WJX75_007142 [Coccomyxa subellipsoidea]|uniref:Uncharacterized protein n=1 Tax=Coccomyxa subellipsoidea TaxID=248742 RepID=A0ABR2YD80_9CHLO
MSDPEYSATLSGCPVQVSPRGWQAYYDILILGKKLGYIAYTTRCTCGKSTKWGPPTGGPHTMKQWVEQHGNHRPEYAVLAPTPEEEYPDTLGVGGRMGHLGYRRYKTRLQSLGFYTSVHMLEKAGFRLPEEQQKRWNELLREDREKKAAARMAQAQQQEQEQTSSPNEVSCDVAAAVQPDTPDNSEDGVVEEMPQLNAQGAAQSAAATEDSGGSAEHQSGGEAAGYRRVQQPPDGWEACYGLLEYKDNHGYIQYTTECTCKSKLGKPILGRVAAPNTLMKWAKRHGYHRPEYAALKPLPDEAYPDTLQLTGRMGDHKYRRYQLRMQSLGFYSSVHMLESAGFCLPEDAQKEWDRLNGTEAALAEVSDDEAQSDLVGGAEDIGEEGLQGIQRSAKRRKAPRIKTEEVVDLSADSPRASSCTQMPGAPAERVPGHEAADGGASQPGSPAVKQERHLPATSAAQPPAFAHRASQGPSAQHNGTRTLGDVIANVTRLEAALAAMERRAERGESLATLKDAEIKSLRSQLELLQS